MNPQSNDISGLSLPTPSLEAQHPAIAMPQQQPVFPQQQVAYPQQPAAPQSFVQPQSSAIPTMPSPQAVPSPVAAPLPGVNPVQPAAPPAVPPEEPVDDDDALDAEWIAKAKAIVEQLRLDPFAETNAFNEIKAEYLQQRHGKTVKGK